MEKMEIFADALKDFRSAFINAQSEVREYKKQSDYVYKPTQARFKAVIYRKDGNTRYYYSYDNKTYNKNQQNSKTSKSRTKNLPGGNGFLMG